LRSGLVEKFPIGGQHRGTEMSKYWGYHLMLDCSDCDREKITSKENIINFTKELVKIIDMKAYGDPIVVHFAEHDPTKAGYSLLHLIETSNIAGHFVDSSGDAYLDVFSCKPFSNSDVMAVAIEFFNPKNINHTFLTRDATLKSAEVEEYFDPMDITQR